MSFEAYQSDKDGAGLSAKKEKGGFRKNPCAFFDVLSTNIQARLPVMLG